MNSEHIQNSHICTQWVKKLYHYYFVLRQMLADFENSFTLHFSRNLQQNLCHIAHHTLRVSLHYLMEYKRSKLAKFRCINTITLDFHSIKNKTRKTTHALYGVIKCSKGPLWRLCDSTTTSSTTLCSKRCQTLKCCFSSSPSLIW